MPRYTGGYFSLWIIWQIRIHFKKEKLRCVTPFRQTCQMNARLLSEELCFKNTCVHTYNWNHGAHWTFILLGDRRNQRELSRYLVSNYFPTQRLLDSSLNLWGFMELDIMVQAALYCKLLLNNQNILWTHFHWNNKITAHLKTWVPI